MENWQFFLNRCLASIEKQSFTDYEVVLIKYSTMPVTSNRVIEAAKGELIKILYMDDYFAKGDSLQEIVDAFEGQWLVTGCMHDQGDGKLINYHTPKYTLDIYTGNNCIGSPSVLTFKREGSLFFDERLSWLLDCDLYKRYFDAFGPPKIIDTPNVVIGLHPAQTSNLMDNKQKRKEQHYVINKFS